MNLGTEAGDAHVDCSKYHICLDKSLSVDLLIPAAEVAVGENALNKATVVSALESFQPDELELAALTSKKWQNGRNLRVGFLNGAPVVHAKVKKYALEWTEYANISFEFVNGADAEIRILFANDNMSWSYLGTDALLQPTGSETMHYGWLRPDTPDEEYSRTVIHEFGHALGCIHEHQNPDGAIQWNKEVVYKYYKETQGWDKDAVDNNLFRRYGADITQFTKVDKNSIMLYPIPKEFTTNGFSSGWNRVLSATDKSFIAEVYPR